MAYWIPAFAGMTEDTVSGRTLPIELEHSLGASKLPAHHKDPFDRLLIAQALAEKLTIITLDSKFRRYDVALFR